ncbi:MAG: hypothetical protein JO368_12925 [Acidimicrobiales bacterium]|nr:hypothetical protein [Acidimicrobiales bacterium]
MSHIRSRGVRAALAAATALVGIGGATLAAGLTAPAASATSSAPPQHYLCYVASAKKGFTVPPGIILINPIAPNGVKPTVGPANLLCNPALKIIPGATFPITNPTWHFLGFKITATQASATLTVSNQFGTGNVITGNPNELLVPSWKSLTGPPNQPVSAPPGEDHYTCYPVKLAKGSKFTPPSAVSVQDEFTPASTGPVNVTVGKPQELCLATTKILPTGQQFPPSDPTLHYLCFKVTKTPIINPVFVQNQFGTGPVTVKVTKWLCLPSSIAGPTG